MSDLSTSTAEKHGSLAGSVALITGASRGIGRAIAEAYAAEGADLCLAATTRDGLHAVEAALAHLPGRRLAIALDVSDRTACFEAVRRIEAEFGRIDILVNNAGIYVGKPFLEYDPAEFQRMMDVNLFGVVHLSQAVLPGMLARGHGRIINIASSAGKGPSRNQSGYNASKHAVVGLTRCVAAETASRGVTVNAICPGFVQTDMVDTLKRNQAAQGSADPDAVLASLVAARVPLGRVLVPDEIAGLAVFLASPQARGMTGQSILVDGGMLMI